MPTSVFTGLAQDATLQAVITTPTGGTKAGKVVQLGITGSDGKTYTLNGVGTGDTGVALQTYTPAQGTVGNNVPNAALQVAFKDVNGHLTPLNVDASGAITLQAAGTTGSPIPAKSLAIGGTDGTNLNMLAVNSAGGALTQSMGSSGSTAPAVADQIGGVDTNGVLHPVSVTSQGALSMQDASSVPEAPLSINGTAFTLGQSGAPSGAITVNTASTSILPDSTGPSAINGVRGQLEVINIGNVDIFVSPSSTTVWGSLWLIRPGGSLITTYSGPVSAITQNTLQGSAVGSPVAQLSVAEWA